MTIAKELAKSHREISVAEFFEKNKHLLGFENLQKSLLTCVREAVDNSLDACEDAKHLPEIYVEIQKLENDRFKLILEDNGPGIVKKNLPKVFAKLLYGGKFNRKQSRGQQGIGISASVLYSQLTTGKPTKIYSRTGDDKVHIFELHIDTMKNEPEILSESEIFGSGHGIRVEMEIKGKYVRGRQSVDEYLKETAIMNPFAKITYVDPDGNQQVFERVIDELPKQAKSVKPHPDGIELGIMIKMLKRTKGRNITGFLTTEFSRVGRGTALAMCNEAEIDPKLNPKKLTREEADKLHQAMQKVKLQKPPTDCLSPVGEVSLRAGLTKEVNPEFVEVISRHPTVYEGHPFQIEVGIAYGGDIPKEGSVNLMRFANKVPLLYQQSACAMAKAVMSTGWKRYGLQQSSGAMPQGPVTVAIHMASIWIPYTSEGKEAIAAYPKILKELKLAIQDVLRKLARHISRKRLEAEKAMRKQTLLRYSEEVAEATSKLIEKPADKDKIHAELNDIIEKKWGEIFEGDDEPVEAPQPSDEDEGIEANGEEDADAMKEPEKPKKKPEAIPEEEKELPVESEPAPEPASTAVEAPAMDNKIPE